MRSASTAVSTLAWPVMTMISVPECEGMSSSRSMPLPSGRTRSISTASGLWREIWMRASRSEPAWAVVKPSALTSSPSARARAGIVFDNQDMWHLCSVE